MLNTAIPVLDSSERDHDACFFCGEYWFSWRLLQEGFVSNLVAKSITDRMICSGGCTNVPTTVLLCIFCRLPTLGRRFTLRQYGITWQWNQTNSVFELVMRSRWSICRTETGGGVRRQPLPAGFRQHSSSYVLCFYYLQLYSSNNGHKMTYHCMSDSFLSCTCQMCRLQRFPQWPINYWSFCFFAHMGFAYYI